MSFYDLEARIKAHMAHAPTWTAEITQCAGSFGATTGRYRKDLLDVHEKLSDAQQSQRLAWAQKTADEILADMAALLDEVPERDEAQRQAEFEAYNRHLFTHSGPPPIIPILHRPPQLAPEEVPRVVAKARAVAVFGPKRGRWK